MAKAKTKKPKKKKEPISINKGKDNLFLYRQFKSLYYKQCKENNSLCTTFELKEKWSNFKSSPEFEIVNTQKKKLEELDIFQQKLIPKKEIKKPEIQPGHHFSDWFLMGEYIQELYQENELNPEDTITIHMGNLISAIEDVGFNYSSEYTYSAKVSDFERYWEHQLKYVFYDTLHDPDFKKKFEDKYNLKIDSPPPVIIIMFKGDSMLISDELIDYNKEENTYNIHYEFQWTETQINRVIDKIKKEELPEKAKEEEIKKVPESEAVQIERIKEAGRSEERKIIEKQLDRLYKSFEDGKIKWEQYREAETDLLNRLQNIK